MDACIGSKFQASRGRKAHIATEIPPQPSKAQPQILQTIHSTSFPSHLASGADQPSPTAPTMNRPGSQQHRHWIAAGTEHWPVTSWWPDQNQHCHGGLVLIHGQGDYSERYDQVAAALARNGVALIAPDLPGHGRSPKARGKMPAMQNVLAGIQNTYHWAQRTLPALKIGLGGHSAGGQLALATIHHRLISPDFLWLNAPLLNMERLKHPLEKSLLLCASRILPQLRISTGVQRNHCRHPEFSRSTPQHPSQFHRKITLAWAAELLASTRTINQKLTLPPNLPILFTQGSADRICKPEIAQTWIQKHTQKGAQISYHEFPESRHEPFADLHQHQIITLLATWTAEQCRPQ